MKTKLFQVLQFVGVVAVLAFVLQLAVVMPVRADTPPQTAAEKTIEAEQPAQPGQAFVDAVAKQTVSPAAPAGNPQPGQAIEFAAMQVDSPTAPAIPAADFGKIMPKTQGWPILTCNGVKNTDGVSLTIREGEPVTCYLTGLDNGWMKFTVDWLLIGEHNATELVLHDSDAVKVWPLRRHSMIYYWAFVNENQLKFFGGIDITVY